MDDTKYEGLRMSINCLYETDDEEKMSTLKKFRQHFARGLVELIKTNREEGIKYTEILFRWLPVVIDSAEFVIEILERVDNWVLMPGINALARTVLQLITDDLLDDVESELSKGDGSHLSRVVLNGLLFLVRNPIFKILMVGEEFEFDIESLYDFNLLESDELSSMSYLHLMEIINSLPKGDLTHALFEKFLLVDIESMSNLYPLFFDKEFSWVLNLGFKYRVGLAYCFVPEFDGEETLTLEIDRANLLKSSIDQLSCASVENLRKGISVVFLGEDGRGTGVLRDWLLKLVEAIVDRDGSKPFKNSGEEKETDHGKIYPRRGSGLDPAYYRCCGRLFGLALLLKTQIGLTLDNAIYVQFAGRSVTLEDVKEAVPTKYQFWKELLTLNDAQISQWTLYFLDENEGDTESTPYVRVKRENVEKYVSAVMVEDFKGIETSSLMEGFDDIMTQHGRECFFKILTLEDLDFILRGNQDVKFDDWKKFTNLEGYVESDDQIRWFWKWVEKLSPEDQKHFLVFWTSTSWLPAGGFEDMNPPLQILKTTDTSRFPSIQTCSCSLHLPPYDSEEVLCANLRVALDNYMDTSGSFHQV